MWPVAPPAARAGLVGFENRGRFNPLGGGDTIVSVDGRPLREQDDLYYQLGAALAGNTVKLGVRQPGSPP